MAHANIFPEKGERNLIRQYHCIPGGACFSVVTEGRPMILTILMIGGMFKGLRITAGIREESKWTPMAVGLKSDKFHDLRSMQAPRVLYIT